MHDPLDRLAGFEIRFTLIALVAAVITILLSRSLHLHLREALLLHRRLCLRKHKQQASKETEPATMSAALQASGHGLPSAAWPVERCGNTRNARQSAVRPTAVRLLHNTDIAVLFSRAWPCCTLKESLS